MTIKNIIVSLVLMSSLIGFPTQLIAQPLEIVNPVNLTLDEQINYFSNLYQSDVSLVRKVIDCESGGSNSTKGDHGNAKGIAQFWSETFNRMSKILGEKLDYNSQSDQVKLLSFAMSKPELAREWTTYRAIMNGGEYTFWYKLEQRYVTVYCKL